MAKAPTVGDALSGVVLGSSFSLPPLSLDMPLNNTEVTWKPLKIGRVRTMSVDSTDSEALRISKSSAESGPTSPVSELPPLNRQRRLSFTEMFFGSSPTRGNISPSPLWKEPLEERPSPSSAVHDDRFKEILKQNHQLLGLDDTIGGFKRKDYMK